MPISSIAVRNPGDREGDMAVSMSLNPSSPLFRWAYGGYTWLVVAPVVVVMTVLIGLSSAGLSLFGRTRNLGRRLPRVWARSIAFATPMRVRVSGREHVTPGRSYVIVANHQSQYDIIVLYGWLGVDFHWVMKKELRRVPILGFACERLGHIFIDRSNHASAIASLNEARNRLTDGVSVVFFPEGTRSRTGDLLPFKKGAFRMALDLGLPILPVTISGTRDILPASSLRLCPGVVDLMFHPPIPVDSPEETSLEELMARTRAVIASSLHPPGFSGGETTFFPERNAHGNDQVRCR